VSVSYAYDYMFHSSSSSGEFQSPHPVVGSLQITQFSFFFISLPHWSQISDSLLKSQPHSQQNRSSLLLSEAQRGQSITHYCHDIRKSQGRSTYAHKYRTVFQPWKFVPPWELRPIYRSTICTDPLHLRPHSRYSRP